MPLAVITKKRPRPPRILIYGTGGIGKTTLGANFPGVLVLPAEEGAEQLDVPRLERVTSWLSALAEMDKVAADPSGYTAFCIDSVTALEQMARAHVASDFEGKPYPSIESIPYGKGIPALIAEWRKMLDRLTAIRDRGLAIVLIGHLSVVKYEDPRTQGYDRFQPRLQMNARGEGVLPMTLEWCDLVLCAAYQVYTNSEDKGFNKERVRAIGAGDRVLYAQERPTHLAKNRYGLPAELPFSWDAILEGIARTFAPSSPAQVVDTGEIIHQGRESVITVGVLAG